ncbi:hypothetical protein BJY01DRAFT_230314 [Aspergillus pseudoustus]|uniref:Uncharacterized protein n=1 Tax=Aspergillus pseudoustus TaxID=1810923 RepID=A0ABR4IDP1_9EURO
MLSILGRTAGIMPPFPAQTFLEKGMNAVLWFGVGLIWILSILMELLPVEMRNREMY